MCTDKDYKKNETLWSLFIDKIDMSPGFVPLLSCRLRI